MTELLPELGEGWRTLDPRYLAMARERVWLRLALWGGVLLLTALVAWWIAGGSRNATVIIAASWLGLIAALGTLWFRLPVFHYRHAAWRIDDEGLTIRAGAWWRRETRVPRSRIQHTDVGQGPLERRHGLGHLAVYTAGTHHSQITLHGIAHEGAISLRDELLSHDDVAHI